MIEPYLVVGAFRVNHKFTFNINRQIFGQIMALWLTTIIVVWQVDYLIQLSYICVELNRLNAYSFRKFWENFDFQCVDLIYFNFWVLESSSTPQQLRSLNLALDLKVFSLFDLVDHLNKTFMASMIRHSFLISQNLELWLEKLISITENFCRFEKCDSFRDPTLLQQRIWNFLSNVVSLIIID